MNTTTFLVTSTKNTGFGTAFAVHLDRDGVYLVTCTRVVETCGAESLQIEGRAAQVRALGCSKDIDLLMLR